MVVGPSAVARTWLAGAVVVGIALLLALAYGVPYGSSNQQTYLLEPLRLAFPELYHRDWLVAQTTPYHPVFAHAVAPLFALDPRGRAAFGIAQLVVQVATYALVYGLVRVIALRASVAVYAALAALLALGAARALAGSYLFAGYLQPSSFATLGWLAAMIAYVTDRPRVCGIALALAGLWHVNFLVLGIGMFGALELLDARGRLRFVRLAWLVGPSFVVLAVFVPSLLAGAHADDPALALRVLVKFHAPGHYDPKQVRHYVPSLLGWLALAWGMRRLVAGEPGARALRLAFVGAAACVAALLAASIPPLLGVTRLFVWRIAPFAQLASQIIAVSGAFTAIVEPPQRPMFDPNSAPPGGGAARSGTAGPFDRWSLAAVVLGLGTIIGFAFHQAATDYARMLAIACGGAIVASVVTRVLASRFADVGAAVAAVLAAGVAWSALVSKQAGPLSHPRVLAPACDGPECAVVAWAQTTPPDTLFLVPPYMNTFRLFTRRAVVADVKSPPLYPDELVEWYRRLCTMADVRESPATADIEARWDAVPAARRVAIARDFGADYLVLDKAHGDTPVALPVAYEDAGFVAYRVATQP